MIFGADPATKKFGWAVLDEHGGRVASGTWLISPFEDGAMGPRLLRLFVLLGDLQLKHGPFSAWGFEVPFSRMPGSVAKQNYVIGCVMAWAEQYGMHAPIEVYPSQLKKHTTGSGKAEKMDMISAISTQFGYVPVDDNDADAVAIAHFVYSMRVTR